MIKNTTYIFFFAIALHLTFILLGLSFYEEGADVFIKNTLSGVFIDTPTIPPFSFGAHFGISYFYLFLYEIFPNFEWYDLFTVLYSSLALTILTIAFKNAFNFNNYIFAFLLSSLIFVDNIFLLEITRISLTLAIATTFLILTKSTNDSKVKIITLQLILTLTIFLRIESFLLGTILVSLIILKNYSLTRNLKYLFPSILSAIILSIVLNIDWTESDSIYNSIRPYQFILLDYETEDIQYFNSIEDSLIISASKLFFLNDKKNITAEKLSKYFKSQDKNIFHAKNYLNNTDFSFNAINKKINRIDKRYYIWFFIIIFLIIFSWNKKQLRVIIPYTAILFLIFLFMKMENRVLFPCTIGLILILLYNNKVKSIKSLTIIITLIFLFTTNTKYEQVKNRIKIINKTFSNIELNPNKSIILFDMQLSAWVGSTPFKRYKTNKTLLTFDNALLYMTEGYKKTMINKFQTDKSPEIYSQFINNDNIIFYGNIDRAIKINHYFNVIYGIDAQIIVLEKISPKTSKYTLKSKY